MLKSEAKEYIENRLSKYKNLPLTRKYNRALQNEIIESLQYLYSKKFYITDDILGFLIGIDVLEGIPIPIYQRFN